MITQLIYTSFARDPVNSDSDRAILETSRLRNKARDITGFLFRSEECFVQLIEGPRANVERVMAEISKDDRHSQLYIWPMAETENRSFPKWSMGYDDVLKSRDLAFVTNLRRSGISFPALRSYVELMADPV